jgi:acetyltransferase-like isoleucine patch superfamily enzyme
MKYIIKILRKLYLATNKGYYEFMIKFINSPQHIKHMSMKCPYPELRIKMWKKMGNIVGEGTYINHSITILGSTDLKPNIVLGKRVSLSPNITFITYSSPNDSILKDRAATNKYIKKKSIEVGDDTWIGAGSILHPGVSVGKRCIIGAMSNVNKDIPNDYIAYGNPVRLIKKLQ